MRGEWPESAGPDSYSLVTHLRCPGPGVGLQREESSLLKPPGRSRQEREDGV